MIVASRSWPFTPEALNSGQVHEIARACFGARALLFVRDPDGERLALLTVTLAGGGDVVRVLGSVRMQSEEFDGLERAIAAVRIAEAEAA